MRIQSGPRHVARGGVPLALPPTIMAIASAALHEAAAGRAETVGKPLKLSYVMERSLEANANKGTEALIRGFSKKAKEDPEGFMGVLKNQ